MERREALRLLGGASVFSALSADWLAAAVRAQAAQQAPGSLKALTPQQNEIVVAMTDALIPATDTRGAKAANVNEFIDLILSDWAADDEKAIFLEGLAEADRRSTALFGHGFAAASAKEQVAILQAFDDELAVIRENRPPQRHEVWAEPQRLPFYEQLRKLTLVGYYTSTIGQEQELKAEIIPGALHGCVPVDPGVKP